MNIIATQLHPVTGEPLTDEDVEVTFTKGVRPHAPPPGFGPPPEGLAAVVCKETGLVWAIDERLLDDPDADLSGPREFAREHPGADQLSYSQWSREFASWCSERNAEIDS